MPFVARYRHVTTVASLRIPAEGFLLGATFAAVPTAEFEVTPVVAHGGDPASFLHASGYDGGELRRTLSSDPSVDDAEAVARTNSGVLYRIEWTPRIRLLIGSLIEAGGTVLSLFGSDGEWHLQTLFPDREMLSLAYRCFEANDVTIRVERISDLESTDHYGRYGLSEQQHSTLVTGFERGYYSVPRDVDTSELASELGITHQALSERLRRAHSTLIENSLLNGARAFD